LAHRDRVAVTALAAARNKSLRVVVPTIVLAETMTGQPSDAAIWHVTNRLVLADLTPAIAARAGALRTRASLSRRKKRDLTVDAVVVSTAMELGQVAVITGDAGDLALLAAGTDVKVIPLA
jgi:predicted nucleic acid-binding protein